MSALTKLLRSNDMSVLSLPRLKFKSERIQKEWESGNVNIKLTKLINLIQHYISIECPDYREITITCIVRFDPEQDDIYLNHIDPEVVKRYKKNPWKSVHSFWRGIDVRTHNMPGTLPYKIDKMVNAVTYDTSRPEKQTCKYHDVGTGEHLHLQVMA